jgi:hypothetical protein
VLPLKKGEASVLHYRLYFLKPINGSFQRAEDLEAADDPEAIQKATLRAEDRPFELWQRGRFVD